MFNALNLHDRDESLACFDTFYNAYTYRNFHFIILREMIQYSHYIITQFHLILKTIDA